MFFLPLFDDNPIKKIPWVTYTIIGLNPDKTWDIRKKSITLSNLGKKKRINQKRVSDRLT